MVTPLDGHLGTGRCRARAYVEVD